MFPCENLGNGHPVSDHRIVHLIGRLKTDRTAEARATEILDPDMMNAALIVSLHAQTGGV